MAKKLKQQSKRPTKRRQTVRRSLLQAGTPIGTAHQQPIPPPSDEPDPTRTKIFPRNLTARAEFPVTGNPMVTRTEDAVANCFPGLELDIRNLDRRFFPGLVFNFVEPADVRKKGTQYGAKLAYVDALEDPDLQLNSATTQHRLYDVMKIKKEVAQALYDTLTADPDPLPSTGNWYLEWLQVGNKRISMRGLTGLTVWRLVRELEQGPVSIGLEDRDRRHEPQSLHGWRRMFTDPLTGVISTAYQPGELMQGLCSPWQHDFRDCYCHYWASNRPDLVMGEVYPGEPVLPGGDAEDPSINIRVDWMRAYRSRELAVRAFPIIEKNRPYQFDHYQINHQWQNLNIVLEGREIESVHLSDPLDAANPFENPGKLADELRTFLTPLELTLVFEYLYARFSLRDPNSVEKDDALRGAITLAREYLLLIAVSEMQHLRWGNELLWELRKAGKIATYDPIVRPSEMVPRGRGGPLRGQQTRASISAYVYAEHKTEFRPSQLEAPSQAAVAQFQAARGGADAGWRPRALRPLTPDVQQDFINIEHPSAFIDGAYARVVATLRQPGEYPQNLVDLAQRIVSDGVQHESRLNTIKAALAPFNVDQYLRPDFKPGNNTDVRSALKLRDGIIDALKAAYIAAASDHFATCAERIANARVTMSSLLTEGERLAEKKVGIPFFDGL
jgi:Ferritin-like